MHRGRRNVLSITTMDRKRGHGLNCSKRVLGCYTVLGFYTVLGCYADKYQCETPKLVTKKTRDSVKGNIIQIPSSTPLFLNGPQAFTFRLISQMMEYFRFPYTTHFHKEMFFSYKYNSNRNGCISFIQRRKYPFSNTRQKSLKLEAN